MGITSDGMGAYTKREITQHDATPEDETYVTVFGVLPDFRRRFELISIGIHDILLSHVSAKLGTSILKTTARG